MIGQARMRRHAPTHSSAIERARIERVIFASQCRTSREAAVDNARQMLSETMAIISAIETCLEKLLAVVERVRTDQPADRFALLAKEFDSICSKIDELAALCSDRGSLIDSSGFAMSIDVGLHGRSVIKIPHVNLTSGPEGLALRSEVSALLDGKTHDAALTAVQQAFVTLSRVQRAYRSTSRWLEAA